MTPPFHNQPKSPPSYPVQTYPYPTVPQFRCPFCQAGTPPIVRSKISTGGWVVFVVLLLFCFPLFWIGLLMTEPIKFCSTCGMRLQ
ncbi:MAG: hypothetical protein DMF63_02085 [Acidobacteria bacterium]|nr:MAG: hypothetical protein DMF63_02085 [Acidobacteriota bacterium]